MAVAIVVDERATGSPARRAVVPQARLLRHVGESAVAVISVERVLSPVGAEKILESIVVVVAHAHRRSPAHLREAALRRHVGERAVAVVFVEAVRRFGRSPAESCAAQDENVHPAVVVVVDERAAAARGFDDVVRMVWVSVDCWRGQACFARNVGEVRIKRPAGCRRLRLRLYVARCNALRKRFPRPGTRRQRQNEFPAADLDAVRGRVALHIKCD